MPASYPGAIKAFTDQTDNVDNVDATDINQAYDEIEAIETELGTDPAGSFATVKLLLAQTVAEKATAAGQLFYATAANAIAALGIGAANRILRVNSAGTAPEWAVQNPRTLNVVSTDIQVVNTTTETTVYSFTVPGGTLSTNRLLRLSLVFQYINDSGAARLTTIRLKYGGTTLATAARTVSNQAEDFNGELKVYLKGNAATNAQRGTLLVHAVDSDATGGPYGHDMGTSAVDSTANQTFAITVEHPVANANLSFTRHAAYLEVWEPT